jgi:putative tryptophan/tyrosine transport system substrate-binding protein
VALANEARIPALYPFREFFETGGLVVYAVDLQELFRGTGDQLEEIFRGVDPGTIPIRHPTRFEFLINLRAARAIGLTIPPTLFAPANEVID